MAEDSKDKPQQEPTKNPAGTSLIVVRTKEGTTRELLKTADGKFAKKPKPLTPTVDFTRRERKFLNSPNEKDKKLTEHEVAFRHVMRIAQGEGSGDPKADMAAVKAYEVAMRRALGKEDPSERELDKLERQPIAAYFVTTPPLMNPELVDADKVEEKPKQPSFAEVLGVVTNKKE